MLVKSDAEYNNVAEFRGNSSFGKAVVGLSQTFAAVGVKIAALRIENAYIVAAFTLDSLEERRIARSSTVVISFKSLAAVSRAADNAYRTYLALLRGSMPSFLSSTIDLCAASSERRLCSGQSMTV